MVHIHCRETSETSPLKNSK